MIYHFAEFDKIFCTFRPRDKTFIMGLFLFIVNQPEADIMKNEKTTGGMQDVLRSRNL